MSDDSKALVAVPEDGAPANNMPDDMQPELSNIRPIPTRKTLMIVNAFVVQTTGFVNRFATLCENRLRKIATDVQKLEISLAILEAKLGSIEWLAGAESAKDALPTSFAGDTNGSNANGNVPTAPPVGAASAGAGDNAQAPAAPGADAGGGGGGGGGGAAAAPAADVLPVSKDPTYAYYFKMLKIGARKEQLRDKMIGEGLDPAVLDMDPMDPTPSGATEASLALVKVEDAESSSDESEVSDLSD
eukprot:TRINITY_DN60123_c0_g1_i1.p1 TRINITY_DN60123_c0_g1~~TRINITY_DN60123_c0_g1_i1.p1  ORF type:complete len:245 (-),score=103.05 TRINITY_DN60123_c0_g1_i1:46-780(-)